MAQRTRDRAVLRELFDALGNDPFVIAECLARPALAERLVTDLYTHEQRIHGEVKVEPEYRRASADNRAPYEHGSGKCQLQASHNFGSAEWMQ